MPPTTASARTAHWLWPPLLLLGCVTALIAWLLIALTLGNQAGWMAVVAAWRSSGCCAWAPCAPAACASAWPS